MNKEIVTTDAAPAAIGPYSQAVKANGLVFVSGQIPLDPETGQMMDADVRDQTQRVLQNLEAALDAAGSSMDSVVKTTIYLKDMADFAVVNEVYGSFFNRNPPARATVEVSRLPKDAMVEIEAIALINDG